ncbi:MAG: hypothetical protein GKS00_01900 [Alphaproteobacteria bacterium]|nr:hypothetical protein [Alphaproteobacteria bacterium]
MTDDRRGRGGLDIGDAQGSAADGAASDLSGFKPRREPPRESLEPARRTAGQSGFTARHAPPAPAGGTTEARIDGRSLRATDRTAQLNIAVHPATRDRFWTLARAAGVRTGEDFLKRLMDGFLGREEA